MFDKEPVETLAIKTLLLIYYRVRVRWYYNLIFLRDMEWVRARENTKYPTAKQNLLHK